MKILSIGDEAPDFCLPDMDGEVLCLNDLKGGYAVIYFYPRDGTPGCTRQAKEFSANLPRFHEIGVRVLGISPDSIKSHKKFAEKNDLSVKLLSDEERGVVEAYGAWQEKSMYGKSFLGVVRSTFIIDPKGKIVSLWPKVRVPGHIEEIFSTLETLMNDR